MATLVERGLIGAGATDVLVRALNLRRDDVGSASRLILFRFCAGFTFIVTETVAMTLFLSRFEGTLFGFEGIAALPVVYILGAAATAALGALLVALQRRFAVGRLIVANMLLVLGLIGGFYLALGTSGSIYLYPALLVIVEVIWVLFALNAEITANCILDVRQAKRVMALVNGGETISFILGAYAVAALAPLIGVANLLLLAAAFLAAALGVYLAILRTAGPTLGAPAPVEHRRRRATPILRLRFVWLMAALVVLLQIALYVTYTQSRAAINLTFEEIEIAICLGMLEGSMGLARALLALFAVNRVIARIGLFGAANLLPAALIATGLMVVLSPVNLVFLFIVAAYAIDRVLRFSFGSAALPLMYHCLAEQRKPQAQAFISGIVAPFGAGLAGLLLLLIEARLRGGFADLAAISYGLIAIGAIALPVLWLLRREYLTQLLHLARGRRLDVASDDIIDPSAIALIRRRLDAADPIDVVFAIDTLQKVDPAALARALPSLLRHPAAMVRIRALEAVAELRARNIAIDPAAVSKFTAGSDGRTRVAAIRALAIILGEAAVARLKPMTADSDREVRIAALAALARWGSDDGLAHARPIVGALAGNRDPESRIEALDVVRKAGVEALWPAVAELIDDKAKEVRARAIAAAGRLKLDRYLPALVGALDDPATAGQALQSLFDLGTAALPVIEPALADGAPAPRNRAALLRLAGHIDDQRAQALVIRSVSFADIDLRQLALEQLFRAPNLRLALAGQDRLRLIEDECRYYHDLGHMLLIVERDRARPGFDLLADALVAAMDDTIVRVLFALRFECPEKVLRPAYVNWTRLPSRPIALELLDNVLRGPIRDTVLTVLDQFALDDKLRRLSRRIGPLPPGPPDLRAVILRLGEARTGRFGDWLRICALLVATAFDQETRAKLAAPYRQAEDPILREVAAAALVGDGATQASEEAHKMLSTIEKLLFLKKVPIFREVRDAHLASLAHVLDEVAFDRGEAIVKENEVGESMFILVTGAARVEVGGRTVATIESGECFGEMAVLDAEPRSATVIAEEDSVLLVVEGHDLFDIMGRHIEVARGLFRVLTGRLRRIQRERLAPESPRGGG